MWKHETVAVLGGDMRQVCLAQLLLADGLEVMTWGLERGDAPNQAPLHQALEARILIFPLPVCRQGKLNLPLTDTELAAERLWPRLRYDQLLLGGMTGELAPRLMADFGLTMLDYYQREELQVMNAIPTAEGALQLAMEATDRTLHASRCLVIGFGRIGKLLSQRLRALGADVTVSARRYADLAWIDALGCRGVNAGQLEDVLGEFDLIFNTAPALILDADRLKAVQPDCVVLDLASTPGGADGRMGSGPAAFFFLYFFAAILFSGGRYDKMDYQFTLRTSRCAVCGNRRRDERRLSPFQARRGGGALLILYTWPIGNGAWGYPRCHRRMCAFTSDSFQKPIQFLGR